MPLYAEDGITLYSGRGESDVFAIQEMPNIGSEYQIDSFAVSDDTLDLSGLIDSYDPLTDAITDFVYITDQGVDSVISVDADGGADNFVQVASVLNVTGLDDEVALINNGSLVV